MGAIPTKQRVVNDPFGRTYSARLGANHRADKPLSCKKRHLRVIGYPADAPVMGGHFCDTVGKLPADAAKRPELDLCPPSVANSPAKQAGADVFQMLRSVSFSRYAATMPRHYGGGRLSGFSGNQSSDCHIPLISVSTLSSSEGHNRQALKNLSKGSILYHARGLAATRNTCLQHIIQGRCYCQYLQCSMLDFSKSLLILTFLHECDDKKLLSISCHPAHGVLGIVGIYTHV